MWKINTSPQREETKQEILIVAFTPANIYFTQSPMGRGHKVLHFKKAMLLVVFFLFVFFGGEGGICLLFYLFIGHSSTSKVEKVQIFRISTEWCQVHVYILTDKVAKREKQMWRTKKSAWTQGDLWHFNLQHFSIAKNKQLVQAIKIK